MGKSVVEDFSLLCRPQWVLTQLLGYIFLSSALLTSPLILLNRVMGRKWSLLFFGFVQVACCLLTLHTKKLYVFSLGLSLNLSCALAWLISAYLYIIESSGKSFHRKSFVVYIVSISSSMISCSFISYNYMDYTSVNVVLLMVLIVFNVFYLSMV